MITIAAVNNNVKMIKVGLGHGMVLTLATSSVLMTALCLLWLPI
jgi:hypothetical protein